MKHILAEIKTLEKTAKRAGMVPYEHPHAKLPSHGMNEFKRELEPGSKWIMVNEQKDLPSEKPVEVVSVHGDKVKLKSSGGSFDFDLKQFESLKKPKHGEFALYDENKEWSYSFTKRANKTAKTPVLEFVMALDEILATLEDIEEVVNQGRVSVHDIHSTLLMVLQDVRKLRKDMKSRFKSAGWKNNQYIKTKYYGEIDDKEVEYHISASVFQEDEHPYSSRRTLQVEDLEVLLNGRDVTKEIDRKTIEDMEQALMDEWESKPDYEGERADHYIQRRKDRDF